MQILESMFFGKFFFEVALVLRSSLLLSSLLLNSEAWVNLSDNNIRGLEQTDEILLSKILDCDGNSSNVFKYLELGVYPIRFEIMKRKTIFLQYILQQEKNSMMYKVFQATCESPVKNDFVKTCSKYLDILDIKLSFDEISQMSQNKFKQIVKQKTEEAAFKYVIKEKNKQSKISHLKYSSLKMQEYLLEGNKNTHISRLIFKARGRNLDIKTHKQWKYDDDLSVGCGKNVDSEEELLTCESFSANNETISDNYSYNCFFEDSVTKMVIVAKIIDKRIKTRKKILEDPG